jgi:outer membrane protein
MKILRIPLLTLTFLICFCALAFPEAGKFGFVNSLRIQTEYKEFADAQDKLDKDVAMWQVELDSMKTEIDSLQYELDKQSLLLSEEKKKEKEDVIRDKKLKYKQYSTEVFGVNGKMERRNAELVKPIRDKIMLIIEKIAREGNYSFIFDSVGSNIAYADNRLDLTDKVLEELSKLEK